MKKRMSLCALLLVLLALTSGCTTQLVEREAEDLTGVEIHLDVQAPQEDGAITHEETVTLYVLSEDGSRLNPVPRTITADSDMSRSEAALQALLDNTQENYAWPEVGLVTGTRVYELSGGVATVDLPARARALTPEKLFGLRMAITSTLTEFSEVSYVNVLVGGREEGFDLAGTLAVGALSRQNDLDVDAQYMRLDELRQSADNGVARDTTLYFPSADGQWTLPEVRSVTYASASAIDYLYTLLEELGRGTNNPLATDMPAPMKYIEEMPEIVRTEDGAARAIEIQFNASLDEALEEAGLTRAVYLAALTDTLMGFVPGVDGLRVLIGGDVLEALEQTPWGEAVVSEYAVFARDDFAGAVGAPVVIYVPAQQEGKLQKSACVLAQDCRTSLRDRLTALMRTPALPSGLSDADILAVSTQEDRILVNLSAAFAEALSQLDAGQERVAIYAMVNTLTEPRGAVWEPERVAFFFEGEQVAQLAGGLELRGDLTRNPGMVVNP